MFTAATVELARRGGDGVTASLDWLPRTKKEREKQRGSAMGAKELIGDGRATVAAVGEAWRRVWRAAAGGRDEAEM